MLPAIVAAIGAAASLASAGIGAASSAKKSKEANRLIAAQEAKNQKWYEDRMNQDYTKRSDNQAILKKQKELLDDYYKRTAATNVVSGGTDEAAALQKQAANQSLSDTMTNMAAQASSYKDSVEQSYRQADAQVNQQKIAVNQNQAAQIAAAAGQGVSAGLNLMGSAIGQQTPAATPATTPATASTTSTTPILKSTPTVNTNTTIPSPKGTILTGNELDEIHTINKLNS